MKRIQFIFLLLVLLVFYSCTFHKKEQKTETKIERIILDPELKETSIDASFLIDSSYVEYIALETNEDCLIADVKNVFLKKNKIIIYDNVQHAAFIFNRDGSFHTKIHRIGNGPGEYSPYVYDMFATDSYIAVFCSANKKILLYDYDGRFVEEFSTGVALGHAVFTFDEENFHFINGWGYNSPDELYGYYCVNRKNGRITKGLPYTKEDIAVGRGWGLKRYASFTPDRALALRSTTDTIYQILPDGELSARYYVDIIKNKIPRELAEGNNGVAVKQSISSDYILGIEGVLESEKYIFLTYQGIIATYSKVEKKIITSGIGYRVPSWDNYRIGLSYNSNIIGDTLVSTFNPYVAFITQEEIESSLKKIKDENFRTKYLHAIKKTNAEGNPIVRILKLK